MCQYMALKISKTIWSDLRHRTKCGPPPPDTRRGDNALQHREYSRSFGDIMMTWKEGVPTDTIFCEIIFLRRLQKRGHGRIAGRVQKQEKQDKPDKRIPQTRASTGPESDTSYRDFC